MRTLYFNSADNETTPMTLKVKLLGLAVVGAAFAGGAYLYVARPVAARSSAPENVQPETPIAKNFTRYRIESVSTLATFTLDELLRGKPKTVIGETHDVSGDILLDMAAPSNSRVEEVRVNARTLKTDSSARDGAISRLILRSEQAENEFIVFKPGAFQGLPDQIVPEKPFEFDVAGDLTIAGTTKPAAFRGSASLDVDGRLVGPVSASVKRADYNLMIPSVPFVAEVQEDVRLTLTFTAIKTP